MSPSVKIVDVSGILDGKRGNDLRREIGDIVASGAQIVLIDLHDVTFMDSSGLGALVSAQRLVKTSGGKLFLCSVKDQVKMLFDLTKMSRVFEILADREEFNSKVLPTQ